MSLSPNRHWWIPLLCVISMLVGCTTSQNPLPYNESIQRIPIQTIEVDGDRIFYLETGNGPPLILIHGFGGSVWNWEHQQSILSSRYRVITVDLLGSGRSDKPHITYTPSRIVTFLLHFLDALEIQEATFVGNSMGAGLAMATALTAPHRTKALILISGFPQTLQGSIQSPLYRQFLAHRPPLWLAKLGNRFSGRWATRHVLEEILYDHTLITPIVVERSFQNRTHHNTLPPLFSLLEHMEEWDEQYGTRIGDIHQPILLLWGEKDRVFSPTIGADLHKALPQARWHLIPKAGHLLQWESPEKVNSLIVDFLTNLRL